MAARELQDFGVGRCQLWLELDREALERAAAAWPVQPEVYRRGKPFLLATRAKLAIEGRITDSRGKEFEVVNPPAAELDFTAAGDTGGLGFVMPAEVLNLPAVKGAADYFELVRVNGDEKETGFNYDFSLI